MAEEEDHAKQNFDLPLVRPAKHSASWTRWRSTIEKMVKLDIATLKRAYDGG
jgi:hypothetical protein